MKKVKILFTIFVLILGLVSAGYSQYVLNEISNADGLSNSSVKYITEDIDYNLWIGTWDGLNVYDGRSIKTYRYSKNENSISNNIITQIVEQDSCTYWISTRKGLNKFNKRTEEFKHYFIDAYDTRLAVSPDKSVICNVYNKGIYYYNPDLEEFIKIDIQMNHRVIKMYIDSSNNLYTLLKSGDLKKYKLENKNGEISINNEENLNIYFVKDIYLNDDKLAIGYITSIDILDTKSLEISSIDIPEEESLEILTYRNNSIIVNYSEGSCARYSIDDKTFSNIDKSIDDIRINYVYIGSQDIFWLGTQGQGIISAHKHTSPFKAVNLKYPVRSFCQDNNGNILIGTDGGGIEIFNKKTETIERTLTTDDGLSSNTVYTIQTNKNGDFFAGTNKEGLDVINNNRRNSLSISKLMLPNESPNFEGVLKIMFINQDSSILLGTLYDGFLKINIEKYRKTYKAKDINQFLSSDASSSISNNTIYAMVKNEEENEIWLGTRGGGVNKFNLKTETFDRLKNLNANLSSSDILSIFIGSYNNLWIGTSYGLNRFKLPYSIDSHQEAANQEITNNTIRGILEDKNKNIWISTNEGIYFYNIETKQTTHYNSRDGLHNDEFSNGAYYSDYEGCLYFGGVDGFTYFNVDNIIPRNYIPKIRLSELKINDSYQSVYDRLKNDSLYIDYDEKYITLKFLANELINNENCEFSYRVHGYAEEWIENSNNPNIIITNLPPGKYRLDVKCSNGDKVWNDSIYSINIKVGYPWWRTNIAYIVYVLLASILFLTISLIVKNRIKLKKEVFRNQIEKDQQKLAYESKLNFYTNIAHELYTPLTLIYSPAQHLLENTSLDETSKKYINLINNNAKKMLEIIKELMEFRKIESGHSDLNPVNINIKELAEEVSSFISEMQANDNRGISFNFEQENITNFFSDKNCIGKILTNLITNAFKYTPENGLISAKLWQDNSDDTLRFRIKNSGGGLTDDQMLEIFNRYKIFENNQKPSTESTGLGLHLTKSLVEILDGEISVKSKLDKYTEFSLCLNSLKTATDEISSVINSNINNKTKEFQEHKDVNILIVEDEKDIREVIKDILAEYYDVREAADGEQALLEIEKNMPDLVICDILMPVVDGFELIDKIKSNPKTSHIPVITISAKINIEDQTKAFKYGVDLYITKPFNHHYLLTAIENTLKKYTVLKEYFNSSRSDITVRDGITLHHDEEILLKDIITFIEANITNETLNQDKLADHIGVSRASLYETLRRLINKTPSEFIRQIRLEHASKLLITSQLTVAEVMFKSGFLSKSYFHKEFMKQFNASPKEFRQKNQQI